MDLFQNPFHILTATTRDNHSRILDLADERSLLLDADECSAARLVLTTPRKRLAAETAWLPGVGPKRAEEVLSLLESCPTDLLDEEKLLSLARANVLATALSRLPEYDADIMTTWILELADAFEECDLENIKLLINEDRVVAGVPELTDLSALEEEIQERRRYYRHVIRAALDNLEPRDLVEAITDAVESATDVGEEYCPSLIADLVDAYEADAQEFLDKEEGNILILVDKLRAAVDTGADDSALAPLVHRLIQVVKNWDMVAQPIQVSTKSRGLDHIASLRVAKTLRNLAIYLFNQHGKLELCRQLTDMLQEVFAEVGEIAELTADDADTLDDLFKQRARWIEGAETRAEEWRQEVTYEANVGVIFKEPLRISPDGIEWKGILWPLDSLTRIRWGGTRRSVGFIASTTTYRILFGTPTDQAIIEQGDETIHTSFIQRLWRAVGIRILTQCLDDLRDGKKCSFAGITMSDYGIELVRSGFLSSNEQVFCHWHELSFWSVPGAFCIGKKGDKKLVASLSYQDVDNVHILETALRMFWKKGGSRLSSLLES